MQAQRVRDCVRTFLLLQMSNAKAGDYAVDANKANAAANGETGAKYPPAIRACCLHLPEWFSPSFVPSSTLQQAVVRGSGIIQWHCGDSVHTKHRWLPLPDRYDYPVYYELYLPAPH